MMTTAIGQSNIYYNYNMLLPLDLSTWYTTPYWVTPSLSQTTWILNALVVTS